MHCGWQSWFAEIGTLRDLPACDAKVQEKWRKTNENPLQTLDK